VNETKPEPPTPTRSFFQRRGRAILALLIVVVVIAVIIGGAVGATERKKQKEPNTAVVGTGEVSPGQSGIFGASSGTSSRTVSEDSVAVATQPVAASDLLSQVTARHFVTARRR